MPSAIDCNLFLFADDSAILVSHKEKSEVERLLSVELLNSAWLTDNKLSLHLGKTVNYFWVQRQTKEVFAAKELWPRKWSLT